MIRIIQLLCPARHCIAAVLYDPEGQDGETALGKMKEEVDKLGINPWCGICGSPELRYEDQATKFKTMEEAMPEMMVLAVSQKLTRELNEAAKAERN